MPSVVNSLRELLFAATRGASCSSLQLAERVDYIPRLRSCGTMSDWKVRHEGSPTSSDGLTYDEALQGLLDGRWEPTEEGMGPSDTTWIAFETPPQFVGVAADIEPPPPRPHEDE